MNCKPTPIDCYPTATSVEQHKTEDLLAQFHPLPGHVPPSLQRNTHLQLLLRLYLQGFPARMISLDASQPWLVSWILQSFYILGAALDPGNKQRAIDTLLSFQHPDGGFGGGPAQAPHVLSTYAAVIGLAIVGRPGPGGGWDQIDREKLYKFFMSLKQPDGSFQVARHSEVDVRGIYCLLCVAIILNILTPELIAGSASFIASLQTYEGGFANASHPYYTTSPPTPESLVSTPRPPLGEAHGGYTFCGLASWAMLYPFLPKDGNRPKLNGKNLVRWLVNMQGSEKELGGFRGRTNKLVDGCYSWWVGGAFSLLSASGISVPPHGTKPVKSDKTDVPSGTNDARPSTDEDEWVDHDDALFDRIALQKYILYAGQHPAGGLRDKPPKLSDAYHTLYSLSGLSCAQHRVYQVQDTREKLLKEWKPTGAAPEVENMSKIAYAEARCWTEEEGTSQYVNGAMDRVNATHPILNMTMTHLREVMNHFYHQG